MAYGIGSALQYLQTQTVSPAGTTITISNLPTTTFRHLYLDIMGQLSAGAGNVRIGFNGDTGSNYDQSQWYQINGATGAANVQGVSTTQTDIANLPTTTNSNPGAVRIFIPNYRNTNFNKICLSYGGQNPQAAASATNYLRQVTWRNTAAITSITLTNNMTNFVANTIVNVYGVL
jgi:hypothetical protein